MSGKRYSPEEIISKLGEAEVLLAQGVGVGQVVRRLGVTSVTYYRWLRHLGVRLLGSVLWDKTAPRQTKTCAWSARRILSASSSGACRRRFR